MPDRRLTGGEYAVLVRRDGASQAVRVRTGLTDFAYTAVLSGLLPGDSVFILPSTGMLEEERRRQERIRERVGGPLRQ